MDAAVLRPAYQVAMAVAHIDKVPMLRWLLDSGPALARKSIAAAGPFVVGKGKDRYSAAIVDRTAASVAEEIDCDCSLLAKTLLVTIDLYLCLAASTYNTEMRSVGCSSQHGYLWLLAHHIHSAPDFESPSPDTLVESILGVGSLAVTRPRLQTPDGSKHSLAAEYKDCNRPARL